MVDVHVLGQARVDGSAVSGAMAPRTIELLTYLALHPGAAMPRSHVAALFWPDSTEQQARTNLRREMHLLRLACDADSPVQSEGPTLKWQDSPGCRIDVRVFEREVAVARKARSLGDGGSFLVHAGRAVDEYRGDLLPGSYSDWILEARFRLSTDCAALCGLAARDWMEAGDLVRALAAARRRLQLEPLEEAGYRTLMEVQMAAGDRAAAMATYHCCATVLEQDLGLPPDDVTERLFRRLLGQTRAVGIPPSRMSMGPGEGRGQLVGRAKERASLNQLWKRALAGHPGMVLLSGEAGVGKSRLVEEFATAVEADGVAVSKARCFPSSGSVALSPVAQWLRGVELQQSLGSVEDVWLAEVQRLVPDVARHPDADGPADRALKGKGSTPWQQHRFFEALARVVTAAGRARVLVLDDVHWCDGDTLSWLDFLLRYSPESRLLVLLISRPGELLDNAPVSDSLRRMRAAGDLTEMELAPLGPTDSVELAEKLGGRILSGGEAQLLYAASGGYPLFIVEAVGYLPDPEATGRHLESNDLQQLLRSRLQQLSADARQTAALAAVVGTDFGLELLSEASTMDPYRLARSIDELWQRRIMVALTGGRYDFSHDLFRDTAHQSLTPAQQWLHHKRLAEALERLYPHGQQLIAGQLAHHYGMAGQPDKELHYRMLAAEHAAGLFAHTEVLEHYARALQLLESFPANSGRDRQELKIQQARMAALSVVRGYSAPELRSALERTEVLAEHLDHERILLASLMGQFSIRFVHGDTARAYRIGMRAVTMARKFPEYLGQAHFAVGGASLSLGRPHESIAHFQQTIDRLDESVPSILGITVEAHAEVWAAHAHWLVGREEEAVAMSARAQERCRSSGRPFMLAGSLAYCAILHQLRGDIASLRDTLAELGALCDRYQVAYYNQWWQILAGWMAADDGGMEQIEEGIARLRSQKAFARMPYWLSLLATAKMEAGHSDAARAVLDAAAAAAGQNDDQWWLPEVLRLRARLEPAPQSRRLLERAAQHAVAQGSIVLEQRCRMDLAALANAGSGRAGTVRSVSGQARTV